MQIRCAHCTKTVALAATGELPSACPHCAKTPGPKALGAYEALRLLAAGGMGEVYLARHRELGTEVAIKVLPAMPLDTIAAVRERFAREARLTAKVQHPGVVKVHGDDVAGDRPFLVLEYVAGQTLRERLRAGPVPVVEAARIAAATADVLAAAHAHGVLHRDVKPDNVMLRPDGEVRVLDFGIARAVQDDAPITRTGEIVGTPEYMAPEQLLDGPDAVTERTDVHALGVLLCELLTGRSPFHGANLFQALKLVESLVPPPPSRARPDVPQALDAVVDKALAKQPHERFASAAAFAAAVRTAVPEARVAPRTQPTPWLWYVGVPVAAALLLAAGAFAWFVKSLPGYVQTAGTTIGDSIGTALDANARAYADAARGEPWLRDGQWNAAFAVAARPGASAFPGAPDVAREAFTLAHVAWPLAVGAPPWLAATDAAQRQRLLGDRLEPGPLASAAQVFWASALDGRPGAPADGPGWRDGARERASLLFEHLAPSDPPSPATESLARFARSDDALARLLGIASLPPEQRADAFAAHAQRLPLEASEHWLAQMCAHHLRDQPAEGTQAAKMAWLSGAGEIVVLLDAYLQVAPLPGHSAWRPLEAQRLERLRKRVAGAEAADAPARVLLLAFFDALHHLDLDTAPLRTLPAPLAVNASRWFVAHAAGGAHLAVPMLCIATALGAEPDYAQAPWRDVVAFRNTIDAEVQRGR